MSRVDLFTCTNIHKIQEHFDNNPDLDISVLVDQKGNNLLHVAALSGMLQLMTIFVEKMKVTFERKYWNDNSVYKKPVK